MIENLVNIIKAKYIYRRLFQTAVYQKAVHKKLSVREKVEHAFSIAEGLCGNTKIRYRGLQKRTAKLNMLFALANMHQADKRGLPA